jgi:hypothetical protein
LAVSLSIHGYDPGIYALPISGSRVAAPTHEILLPSISAIRRITFSGDILVSTLYGACNPIRCGLNFLRLALSLLSKNFERFIDRSVFHNPVKVKPFGSPGKAGGLPIVIMQDVYFGDKNLKGQTVYYDVSGSTHDNFSGDIWGVTGNLSFIDNTVVLDYANKTVRIK